MEIDRGRVRATTILAPSMCDIKIAHQILILRPRSVHLLGEELIQALILLMMTLSSPSL
jgi:hypothetical protein